MSQNLKNLNGYRQVQVTTSSPEKLLLMVYGGAIKFLKKAKILMGKGQNDKAYLYILKAIAALVELISTLNHQESPEIAGALKKLYVYSMERLRYSIQSGEPGPIDEVVEILSELKASWEEAFGGVAGGALKMTG